LCLWPVGIIYHMRKGRPVRGHDLAVGAIVELNTADLGARHLTFASWAIVDRPGLVVNMVFYGDPYDLFEIPLAHNELAAIEAHVQRCPIELFWVHGGAAAGAVDGGTRWRGHELNKERTVIYWF
jgi:hypothetical protein